MKQFVSLLILLISFTVFAQQDELEGILNGIETAQLKVQNFHSTFTITPLFKEKWTTPTLSGDYKIEGNWLWARNKIRGIIKHFMVEELLERSNYTKPYQGYYYAFNGKESLLFDEEYLEKGLQGYLIAERDPYDMITPLTPNRLWFNNISYPSFFLVDIFKKRLKQFSINTVKYVGEESIDGHSCKVIYCEFKFIVESPEGKYPVDYFKIWVDPQYNYIFRKIECGIVSTPLPQPYDYNITDDIKIKEVMPGFYLPVAGRLIIYKKENGQIKSSNGHRIDIIYQNINIPLKDEDFWFPMRKDRLISNAIIGVWGKTWEEYQQKIAALNKQF
ncbi:MAG: hypothetical protein N2246_04190 [Candidatus Sumerlaeia bacterium]|nr:hypothetical protein [Candidatus Sumerlaeia bacterium]